jgi:hypothetical protein
MPTTPSLTDEQFAELYELIKGADTVELKLTVPDGDHRSAIMALEIDPLEAEVRQVVFFDTPDLQLNQAGVVVRARRIQGNTGDTVVKLRPVVPADLPAELRKSGSFGVEVDAMPGGFVCSASLKGKLGTSTEVLDVLRGTKSIKKLFTKEQRAFYGEHAPDGLDLDSLTPLGPITLMKLKFEPADFGRRLVAEMWWYPDGSRILELSTKCLPHEAFQVVASTRAFLSKKGINLTGEQQTKTRTALDYFSHIHDEEK